VSLWWDTAADGVRRPPLPGDRDVDVAVVGAGFTGLWTAYYLARQDPGLRIAVLEREVAGFGASGRNGGWCSALFPASWDRVARASSPAAAAALRRELSATVDEVGRVAAAEGLDVHYAKGGSLTLATMPAHLPRLHARVAAAPPDGAGPAGTGSAGTGSAETGGAGADGGATGSAGAGGAGTGGAGADGGATGSAGAGGAGTGSAGAGSAGAGGGGAGVGGAAGGGARWLSPAQVAGRVRCAGALGAVYTPQCAALHPGLLVRGLARVVEGLGVAVYERTPVSAITPGAALTPLGRVRAEVVVRATEGYTAGLPGLRRALVPIYSLVIATEPLPASFWDEVGWAGRETLTDARHLVIYAQRTADGRIVFGGRGAPYHAGSRVRPGYDREPAVFAALQRSLVRLFPGVAGARITHRWGGPLGVPRDWFASVGLDRGSGLAWAGGYVGDGVAATNLAGRTLADLILRRDTPLVHLPWVGHRSPRWEPEPLRWLGVNASRLVMTRADATEARTGRPSRAAAWMSHLLGG
jgi:glycine/D-amino acid oxidase-like deaminating enzyme